MPNEKTRIPLVDWLEANKKRQVWLANQLEVSRATVSAWCAGSKKPLKHALALQTITGLTTQELLYYDATDPLLACRKRATARQAQRAVAA